MPSSTSFGSRPRRSTRRAYSSREWAICCRTLSLTVTTRLRPPGLACAHRRGRGHGRGRWRSRVAEGVTLIPSPTAAGLRLRRLRGAGQLEQGEALLLVQRWAEDARDREGLVQDFL